MPPAVGVDQGLKTANRINLIPIRASKAGLHNESDVVEKVTDFIGFLNKPKVRVLLNFQQLRLEPTRDSLNGSQEHRREQALR